MPAVGETKPYPNDRNSSAIDGMLSYGTLSYRTNASPPRQLSLVGSVAWGREHPLIFLYVSISVLTPHVLVSVENEKSIGSKM